MKKIFTILLMTLSFILSSNAQEPGNSSNVQEPETSTALRDTEVLRKVKVLDIEGKYYYDVTVILKTISPDYFISDNYRVKVTVKDSTGKKIWKKTLKNADLYIFSSGQIQVGKPKFNRILITKSPSGDEYIGLIRDKEGIF